MLKYEKYIRRLKEEADFLKEQGKLREKYKDKEISEDKIIIEKSNTYKFTINFLKAIFYKVIQIIILILTSIGLTSILYQDTREKLFQILNELINQIKNML